jgi:probable rRNA maturation factor
VNVFLSDEQAEPVDAPGLRRLAELALESEGFPPDTEMSVVLVDEAQIARYNDRFMGRAGATDVLAFPLLDLAAGKVPVRTHGDPPIGVGDVFLCPSEIRTRAEAEGYDYPDLLFLMLVHGILHLLGYDHGDQGGADAMSRREDELLALVGRTV